MFCTNCGKDCGDFKFCPNCGTQVQSVADRESKQEAWSVGMPCPYCGGMEIKNGCCAFCGVKLQEKVIQKNENVEEQEDSFRIPCGLYKGVSSSITLYDNALVVQGKVLFKKCTTRIPYDQITRVVYSRPNDKIGSVGYLILRWEGNKDQSIPVGNARSNDGTTVTISDLNDPLFYHIYYLLKAMAPKTAQFSMEIPKVELDGLDVLKRDIDLEACYDRFSPHREKAIAYLCDIGVSAKQAKALINEHFDLRQGMQYNSEPTAAIQDLNRILEEQQRQKEQEIQRIKEDRERIDRELLLHRLERIERNERRERMERWKR